MGRGSNEGSKSAATPTRQQARTQVVASGLNKKRSDLRWLRESFDRLGADDFTPEVRARAAQDRCWDARLRVREAAISEGLLPQPSAKQPVEITPEEDMAMLELSTGELEENSLSSRLHELFGR